MKLELDVREAKNKANNSFLKTDDSSELNNSLFVLQEKLDKLQKSYKENLSRLEKMRNKLDQYRTERYAVEKSGENKGGRKPIMENTSLLQIHQKDIETKKNEVSKNPQNFSESDHIAHNLMLQIDEFNITFQKVLDLTNMKNLPEVFGIAEKLERENKEMSIFLAKHEPFRQELLKKRNEVKEIFEKMEIESHEKEIGFKSELTELSLETSDLLQRLNEIENQKKNDEEAFFDVFDEIGELFHGLNCSKDLLIQKCRENKTENQISNENEEEENDEFTDNETKGFITQENVLEALQMIDQAITISQRSMRRPPPIIGIS